MRRCQDKHIRLRIFEIPAMLFLALIRRAQRIFDSGESPFKRISESIENFSEDFSARCSLTKTTPDITNAWALEVESANPHSTSNWSILSFFTR